MPVVHEENTYIKVVGNVRTFGGKRSIGPFGIIPITDMNEVTMHMAEVVQSHMLCSKLATAVREPKPLFLISILFSSQSQIKSTIGITCHG